jgi:threonine aldolase
MNMNNSITTKDQGMTNKIFSSDNTAGAAPAVIQAILDASTGPQSPYGADVYSQAAEDKLSIIFECPVSVFLVPTGTAANALALSVLTPPWGSVLCHPESHINNDECGAPEFFTNGAKLVPVNGANSKICPSPMANIAGLKTADVHSVQPAVVSISQTSESGSVYSLEEINTLGNLCKEHSLRLHMDGARFANALVALECTPAEMTWKAGVDVLSFGATKNGVLAAEAIILFDQSLAPELAFRRKRAGHLMSKMRLLAAQLDAYLTDDLWLVNARQANVMAVRLDHGLRTIEGVEILGVTQANMLFCKLPRLVIDGLLDQGFYFYSDRWDTDVVRLVTNFTTQNADVDSLIDAVKLLVKNY